ncbi:probable succinyl-diaminopimelate desuccinylase [Dysidea avara]|uniref:probable succinyl-diaminopimelate desuccinylase n=1 Tax=Dysidea avara TaxID=196820 RepID=UPI00331B2490
MSRPDVHQLFNELETEWKEIEEEAVEILRKLIQMDTQNIGEDTNETIAAKHLKGLFESAGIECSDVLEEKPGRGNLVARIRGDGSSGLGAVMLSAHLDTVRAPKLDWKAEGWKHDPFGAVIDQEDGCLYGRGAVDMKNMAAMSVSVFLFIKRHGIMLARDLLFVAVADEEAHGSKYGAKYLVEKHPDLIEADIIMTEVGGCSTYADGKEFFPVEIAEKTSVLVTITANGSGGHSSLFHPDNPIGRIGAVCNALSTKMLRHRVTPAARSMLEGISKLLPWYKAPVFRNLLSPKLEPWIIDYLLTKKQAQAIIPVLHNIANPTVVHAGDQQNQIPSSASVTVDVRRIPGCSLDDTLDDLREVIGKEKFLPSVDSTGEKVAPELVLEVMFPMEGVVQDAEEPKVKEALECLHKVVYARSGGSPVIPFLLSGGTDMKFFVKHPTKKPVCLGFSPVRIPQGIEFPSLFHAVNERIPVDGYKWGLGVLCEVVFELCKAHR